MGEPKSIRSRDEVPAEDRWTIDEMYDPIGTWEEDVTSAMQQAEQLEKDYHGRLGSSASVLADALLLDAEIEQKLERAFCYARMKLDEDNTNSESQARYGECVSKASKIGALTSFLMPELVSIPEETILSYIEEEPRLKPYEHLLKDAVRQAEHVLTEKEEHLLASLGDVLGAPDNTFTMLNDADIVFGDVVDKDGNKHELTHGSYINLMRSDDRTLRKNAYDATYRKYKSLINTIASNYQTSVKTEVVTAEARSYPSARNAAMYSDDIPESVYDNLIDAVRDHLPDLHRYTEIRKQLLGVDELRMYDVYVPLIDVPERNIPFDEAVELAVKGLAVLGPAYIEQFRRGIASGWIDKYENKGKTSGAYSFGSYDSKPYVLLNYDATLEDLFTIVHEMGHSMNSYYTRKTQPFIYGDHSIFTAEVASTVNETLMMRYLLEHEEDPEMKKYILNMYLEAFRTTLFRQTMFAEFEKWSHDTVASGESLTPDNMCAEYDRLNTAYFGDALAPDDLIRYEWARIPHFYRGFYVYQYATGYSAANAIANRILGEGESARDDYLEFLKCGTNDYPVELLKIAGVDMSEKAPVESALETFKELVNEFASML